MSVTFSSTRPRGKGEVTQQTIQKMLDENHYLIQCIMDYQSKGKTAECTQYQQILHRNLVYLATIADSNQNMQSLLPAPPNPGMSLGGGGMGGSSAGGSLHSQSNLNDTMAPSSLMQSQMSNGPSHTPMQQQQQQSGPSTSSMSSGPSFAHSVPSSSSSQGTALYPPSRTNLNIQSNPVSMMHQQGSGPHYSSSGGQHYQGQQTMGMMGQSNQGNSMVSQRPIGNYRPAQQGKSGSQYMGQEEFYGEQYGHTPSSSEPVNQQYYPDGHNEYSYQQSSYGEQSYERSFEDSSQHYYESGNPQYSQQQSQYQQSSGQQQTFNQQQYQSQTGYSSQGQGYSPAQGAPSQYSQYQQGQNQQYSSFRSTQSTPGSQTQRSYTYEQGQYGNYQQ
ncbi:calcium-responsive transactivator-like [Neoarius graeffei]|uniref:calcium-responsive transactivator-like n=1 Tax=Neoarius graeffei TaxID=443677 RepID=UPI00298CBD16|nr:calcium-responsive transactivator-like [Neoarius graeffei]